MIFVKASGSNVIEGFAIMLAPSGPSGKLQIKWPPRRTRCAVGVQLASGSRHGRSYWLVIKDPAPDLMEPDPVQNSPAARVALAP